MPVIGTRGSEPQEVLVVGAEDAIRPGGATEVVLVLRPQTIQPPRRDDVDAGESELSGDVERYVFVEVEA